MNIVRTIPIATCRPNDNKSQMDSWGTTTSTTVVQYTWLIFQLKSCEKILFTISHTFTNFVNFIMDKKFRIIFISNCNCEQKHCHILHYEVKITATKLKVIPTWILVRIIKIWMVLRKISAGFLYLCKIIQHYSRLM